ARTSAMLVKGKALFTDWRISAQDGRCADFWRSPRQRARSNASGNVNAASLVKSAQRKRIRDPHMRSQESRCSPSTASRSDDRKKVARSKSEMQAASYVIQATTECSPQKPTAARTLRESARKRRAKR